MLLELNLKDLTSGAIFKAKYCDVAVREHIQKRGYLENKESLITHHLTGDISFDVYDRKNHHIVGIAKKIE